jgi:hypothetical protein
VRQQQCHLCSQISSLPQENETHLKRRHHFLRDHVEKADIEMRYIDTERQLADIFTKPLDASCFADLQGELVFAILMAWFEGELVLYLVYLYLLLFSFIFFIPT